MMQAMLKVKDWVKAYWDALVRSWKSWIGQRDEYCSKQRLHWMPENPKLKFSSDRDCFIGAPDDFSVFYDMERPKLDDPLAERRKRAEELLSKLQGGM
jgi:hypothetical protein